VNQRRTTFLAIGLVLAAGIASATLMLAVLSGFGTGRGDVVVPSGQSGALNAALALLGGAVLLAMDSARHSTRRRRPQPTPLCR
jgi:hypothetical protein